MQGVCSRRGLCRLLRPVLPWLLALGSRGWPGWLGQGALCGPWVQQHRLAAEPRPDAARGHHVDLAVARPLGAEVHQLGVALVCLPVVPQLGAPALALLGEEVDLQHVLRGGRGAGRAGAEEAGDLLVLLAGRAEGAVPEAQQESCRGRGASQSPQGSPVLGIAAAGSCLSSLATPLGSLGQCRGQPLLAQLCRLAPCLASCRPLGASLGNAARPTHPPGFFLPVPRCGRRKPGSDRGCPHAPALGACFSPRRLGSPSSRCWKPQALPWGKFGGGPGRGAAAAGISSLPTPGAAREQGKGPEQDGSEPRSPQPQKPPPPVQPGHT